MFIHGKINIENISLLWVKTVNLEKVNCENDVRSCGVGCIVYYFVYCRDCGSIPANLENTQIFKDGFGSDKIRF